MEKKSQIRAMVTRRVHRGIYDISYHLQSPAGQVTRLLALVASTDKRILSRLSPYLLRPVEYGDRSYVGHEDHKNIRDVIVPAGSHTEYIYTRLEPCERNLIDAIAYGLGVRRAPALAGLVTFAIRDLEVVQKVAPSFTRQIPYSLERGE